MKDSQNRKTDDRRIKAETQSKEVAVSVVVPVYNVEAYLSACLDSILAQTLHNIEILLVNDGSTDRSGQICEEYVTKDARVSVIHKENGGLTSAWKAGVEKAKARFVGFVDSDDWIDVDMYERLYKTAKKEDADLTICGLVCDFFDGREPKTETSKLLRTVYDRSSIEKDIFPVLVNDGGFLQRTIQPARVTKLYRKEIVRKNIPICSNDVSIGEDLQLTFSVVCDAQKICMIHKFYPYHYRMNPYSLTGKYDPKYLEKIKITKRQLMGINQKKQVYDFSMQLTNDFLGLAIMAIKGEVCKNKPQSAEEIIQNIKNICEDQEVTAALRYYRMPRAPLSVKVFTFLMKYRMYGVCYSLAKTAFRSEG